jgi:hypothetical protein
LPFFLIISLHTLYSAFVPCVLCFLYVLFNISFVCSL